MIDLTSLFAKLVFWAALVVACYTYLGYPLLIAAWARLRPRRPRSAQITPTVSIIIAAHNEEARIAAKLESCFALDYPQERLEVIVASDGSTDNTDRIVEHLRAFHTNLRLVKLDRQRGKAAALNAAVAAAQGELVIFTDARQALRPDAARALVAGFADETVGAVSGELVFVDERSRPQMGGIGFYWRYEKWLRKQEAVVHSLCGATGALYAIRRELIGVLPEGLILDDVMIPMRAVLAGYRTIFASNAVAYDYIAENPEAEFARKVRTLCGNYQLLAFEPRLLDPRANPIFVQFFSHKVMRLIAPFSLIALLAANLFLLSGFYLCCFALQMAWYALAVVGHVTLTRVKGGARQSLSLEGAK